MIESLPRLVARIPASVHAKLAGAFLAIVGLLIVVGTVGLQQLSGVNRRAEDLVKLHRKMAAYRQLQHDTTSQLSSVASALQAPDEQTLEATLRQLNQFGYNLDRLEFVARDEVELLGRVREDYEECIQVVTHVIELVRQGRIVEGREIHLTRAGPLADRLERLTNELVNKAEADMVASVVASHEAYATSRGLVIGFALGSIALALVLGYAISWSLIGPVKQMDARLKEIASGDFSRHVAVQNADELGALAANLNRMSERLGELYDQLEAASKHKSRFLANVNHELRTPVSAIIGYARLILRATEGQISPLQRENLQDLLNNAKRLLTLIDSLLEFAKIEAGKVEVRLEPVEVGEIVREAVSTIEPILHDGTVRLVRQVAPGLPTLNTDREKLRHIILNLLDNAAKYTERGEIKITASQQNGSLELVVADTGVGLEQGQLGQIFEEFQRGDSSSAKKPPGAGLGLAIVKRFVLLLGGDIRAASEAGKGSTFTVVLPFDRHEP